VYFVPWQGNIQVGMDAALDGGKPVKDEPGGAGVGGV
jgi:hypothetical protein